MNESSWTTRISRRTALKLAGAVGLTAPSITALLAACTSSSTTSSSAAAKVTSGNVRWRVENAFGPSYVKLVDQLKTDNPKLKVDVAQVDVSAAGITWQRLAIQAGLADLVGDKNPKFGFLDPLLKAHLLRPLDDYYALYGWKSLLAPDTVKHSVRDNKIWMVTPYYELPGAIYRKSTFDKLGLKQPQSWDDLLSVLQALKSSGVTPMTVAARGFSFLMLLHNMLWASIDPKSPAKVIFGDGKWTDPPVVAAAEAMRELYDKKLIDQDALSIQVGDAFERFAAGKAAINITGTWHYPTTKDKFGDDFDMFSPPGPGGTQTWCLGESESMVIPHNAKDPDAAAALLNYMIAGKGAQVLLSAGNPLATKKDFESSIPQIKHLPLFAGNSAVYVFGWPPEATTNAWQQGISSVLDKSKTPAQWAASVQKAWEQDIAAGNVPASRSQLL